MKKLVLFSICCVSCILLSTSMLIKSPPGSISPAPPPVVTEVPYLPPTPYDYDINFPQYLKNNVLWVNQNAINVNAMLSDQVATLGRVLFYDKLLSADNTLSCSSCHKQANAFGDNQPVSEGIDGAHTFRNSPTIAELGWKSDYLPLKIPLFWNAAENDLNEMVLMPIVHEGELGKDLEYLIEKLSNTEYYPALFEEAFGDQEITADRIAEGLAQFVRSLSGFDTKFDKVMNGQASFTPAEAAGHELFKAQCNICHTAPQFSIVTPVRNFFPTGEDPGFGGVTGIITDDFKFKSPTLRNISLTAPYMHNGAFETLEEVLVFYSDSLPNVLYYNTSGEALNLSLIDLSESDVSDMIAFLNTLTSTHLTTHPRFSDPFLPPNSVDFRSDTEKISVYPNPFRHSTLVEWPATYAGPVDVRLLDASGKVLKSDQTILGSYRLEGNGLSPGIYFLEVHLNNRKFIKKLLIQ